MAFGALIIHWVLILCWGLAMNDAGGYLYCRLVMPYPDFSLTGLATSLVPWIFTVFGSLLLVFLGVADKRHFNRPSRLAFYPVPLFALTQVLLMWLNFASTRT